MAMKHDVHAQWADLAQRLDGDPKLAEVLESIDKVLGDFSEKRERLKVPYANATSLDNGDGWKAN